jgi:hypothetical protein
MKRVIGIGFGLVLAIATWWSLRPEKEAPTKDTGNPVPSLIGSNRAKPELDQEQQPNQNRPARRLAAPRVITAEQRQQIIDLIEEARKRPVSPSAERMRELDETEDNLLPAPPTKLTTREYIREQLDGLFPLIQECYATAKAANPDLASRIPVEFTIGGEPGIGGIVTEAGVDPALAEEQELTECITETLYTLEIDPPENGGEVNVKYPFNFEDEEEGV